MCWSSRPRDIFQTLSPFWLSDISLTSSYSLRIFVERREKKPVVAVGYWDFSATLYNAVYRYTWERWGCRGAISPRTWCSNNRRVREALKPSFVATFRHSNNVTRDGLLLVVGVLYQHRCSCYPRIFFFVAVAFSLYYISFFFDYIVHITLRTGILNQKLSGSAKPQLLLITA